jgi:hypothetical protein
VWAPTEASGIQRVLNMAGKRYKMGWNGNILLQYRTMCPQDQATFRRWLRLNAVVGSM